jgi:hypothetical protein
MNNKVLTIAAVLAATLVAGVFATTPMAAYAGGDDGDSSETNTEQSIKQKNSGGDGSTNINCGENDINSASRFDVQVCGTLDVEGLGGMVTALQD